MCQTEQVHASQVKFAYRIGLGGHRDSQVYSQERASYQNSHFNATARTVIKFSCIGWPGGGKLAFDLPANIISTKVKRRRIPVWRVCKIQPLKINARWTRVILVAGESWDWKALSFFLGKNRLLFILHVASYSSNRLQRLFFTSLICDSSFLTVVLQDWSSARF